MKGGTILGGVGVLCIAAVKFGGFEILSAALGVYGDDWVLGRSTSSCIMQDTISSHISCTMFEGAVLYASDARTSDLAG